MIIFSLQVKRHCITTIKDNNIYYHYYVQVCSEIIERPYYH